jgi:hypothetical protein
MKLRRDYHNHLLRGTVDDIDSRGAKIVWEQTSFGFANQLSFKPKESSWRWDAPAS